MSAQRASAPARLAGIVAAVALLALAAVVALRLIPRREASRPAAPAPPPEGRVVDLKERIRHEEYRAGRLVTEVRGDAFSLGPDGRNRLKGSVEVVRYGPKGEIGSRLTADEVVYDKGALVFTVTGGVRVEADGVILEGESFDYDQTCGLFTTRSGGAFSAEALRGRAREIAYAEGPAEIRLGGGFRIETGVTGPDAEILALSGETLSYARRDRRGRVEGKAGFASDGFKGSAAAASFAASADESVLGSAVLEGGAEIVLVGKGPPDGSGGEIWADRIAVDFSPGASGIAIGASGGSRLFFRSPPERTEAVLAPTAFLNFFPDEGRVTWSASGGVRAEIAEAGVVGRTLEGADAALDRARILRVSGTPGLPAVVDSAETRIEAPSISIDGDGGGLLASGGVNGVLKGEEGRRKAGFFSPGEDITFSCRILEIRPEISTTLFSGDVLVRQGADAVRADELEIAGEAGRMSGRGGISITLTEAAKGRVRARTVELGGRELAYRPDTGTLVLTSKAYVRLPEARLEAGTVSAVIVGEGGGFVSLSAGTGVVVSKDRFEARAEAAFYEAASDRLVLTGKPVLTDPEGGSARGAKLTFDLADDKILIENEAPGRSATVIRS